MQVMVNAFAELAAQGGKLINMSFSKPQKRIVTKEELEEFQHSTAYEDFIGYIERLNDSVKGCKIDSEMETSAVND